MARSKGSVDPDQTQKLDVMAELIVSFQQCAYELSVPEAARLVVQMWANGVCPSAASAASCGPPREELLDALARGLLALSPSESLSVQRARERAEEMTPPRIAGTNPRRVRAARDRAGRLAMAAAIGERSRRLTTQVEALSKGYHTRGRSIEDRWFHAHAALEAAERKIPWVIG